MSAEVSQSKLEAAVLAFVDDLDSDQGVRSDRTGVRGGCRHAGE